MNAGPVAVVTGGARGIGRATAAALIARGYRVVLGDLDLAVTRATVEETVGPIAVWINNAGIMPTGRFTDQGAALSGRVVDVNYRALVTVSGLVVARMLERGSGTVVNMASATATKPLAGLAVYSGTKAAVVAFSDSLRRELRGTGVRVRVVLPNLVATDLGAGITAPRGFSALTADDVAAATVRAIASRRFATTVPGWLGPLLSVSRLLPHPVQDWIDDRVDSDRIGLGGDPAARAAYLRGLPPAE
ncbi:SDR family oxidoreductase [Conyzicola nivalis]|uniref:Short-chain dehydrogenase n=1 Tax=Conyzicola nivalis TaxID=1477021 RepID=A0A916SLG8_9MICO|nr:SDR family NAD(P)-dependent oxidoreductase [Conyzicola nivalis]GGB02221.1 short-chain dehydrogenase [Conyzicola nivalis]